MWRMSTAQALIFIAALYQPAQDDVIHFDRLNRRRIPNTKPAIPKTTTAGIANTPSAETSGPQ
jgi:hypothetical protein